MQEKLNSLNPLIKQVDPKVINPQNCQVSLDKIPEAALRVKDAEGLNKEVADLTRQLKLMFFENKQVQKHVNEAEKIKRQAQIQFDNLLSEKNLI